MPRTLLVSLLVLTLLLSACADAPKRDTKSTPPPEGGPITLRLLVPPGAGPSFGVDHLIAAFQDAHPEYRVQTVVAKGEGAAEVRAEQADVALLNLFGFDHHNPGLLMDLEPYIRKSNFDLTQMALPREQMLYQGRFQSLPFIALPRVLFANLDLFKQANVPLPGSTWTWEQFQETAHKLTSGTDKDRIWGLSGNATEYMTSMHLMEAMDYQPAWHADEAAMKNALRFFTTMIHTDRSAPPPEKSDSGPLRRRMPPSGFPEGKAAMSLEGLPPGNFESMVDFNLTMLPFPAQPGKKGVMLVWFYSLSIPNNSKNPEAAWEFIRFAAGPEGALVLAKNRYLPMYMDAAVQEAWIATKVPGAEHLVNARWMGHLGAKGGGIGTDMHLTEVLDKHINQALTATGSWEKLAAEFAAYSRAQRGQ